MDIGEQKNLAAEKVKRAQTNEEIKNESN